MATSTFTLRLLGVVLLTGPSLARIISFHAPSPVQPKFVEAPIFGAQHLYPVVASEPAPVREEQNEPPPPDSRARGRANFNASPNGMLNPAGFAADLANMFNPPRPAMPSVPQGVVQVLNQVIPNLPPRIVSPPPPEAPPATVNIQPFSIDPFTGEPLKTVSPQFRSLVSPTASPVTVPNPINQQFGRGFGGAPILDVTGQGQNSGFFSDSSFQPFSSSGSAAIGAQTFGPSTAAPLLADSEIANFRASLGQQSSSSGFKPSFGVPQRDESSVSFSSSSQSLPGAAGNSFSSTVFH